MEFTISDDSMKILHCAELNSAMCGCRIPLARLAYTSMAYTSIMTTTIRVDEKTRDRLARRADSHGRSIGDELAAILEDLRWQEFEQDTAELRATPELYAGYLAESAQWLNADLGDGLAESAAAEYPEYQGGQA